MASKIPFGYRIVGGKAEIDEREAYQLKLYFKNYLEGDSMSAAAKSAGLACSSSTYPHLLKRKEYTGTDYYPAIISPEYQKRLISEWEKRKGESPRMPKKHIQKGVRIYTDFKIVRARGYDPEDPVDCAAALYQRIRPAKKKTKAPDGR